MGLPRRRRVPARGWARAPSGARAKGGGVRLSVTDRHERIVRLVREGGRLRVVDLAAALGVSPVTVRRDVEALASRGRVRRAHGSVAWAGPGPSPAAGSRPASCGAPDREAPGAGHPAGDVRGPVVGMLVPAASGAYGAYAEVLRGAREAARAAGARLVVEVADPGGGRARDGVRDGGSTPAEGDAGTGTPTSALAQRVGDAGAAHIAALLAAGVDGLLLTPAWPGPDTRHGRGGDSAPAAALPPGVPAVLVERRAAPGTGEAELDRVCADHVHGACTAVRHLAAQGRRRIALLARPGVPETPLVTAGYRAGLAAEALTAPVHTAEDPADPDDPAAFDRLLGELPALARAGAVDAVLVHSDTEAIVLLRLLRAHGLRVPEDVALVAYDDELAALADVPLTAVAPPRLDLGRTALRMLLERIAECPDRGERSPRRHVELLPRLRVRASTALAPRSV
jgi:DNA-binding LacI/PurR family transcriptional regulator